MRVKLDYSEVPSLIDTIREDIDNVFRTTARGPAAVILTDAQMKQLASELYFPTGMTGDKLTELFGVPVEKA